MATVGSPFLPSRSQRWLPWLLLALLVAGCAAVLWPFAAAIVWAVVLAYVTWPVYRRARNWLRWGDSPTAFVMTAAVSGAVILPLLWLGILVHAELMQAFPAAAAWIARAPSVLPAAIRQIPGIGPQLSTGLTSFLANITGLQLAGWLQRLAGPVAGVLGGIGRSAGKLVVTLIVLFFVYRDGDRVGPQSIRILRHLGARGIRPYLEAAGAMTRAVLYGYLVTALAQGVIAGVGYRIGGVNAPVLLGALTAMLSILPIFGTALVWVPVAGWLLASGDLWQGIFILAWGAVVVHPTDNLLHSLLISSVARAPLPVVFLGVLGGLSVFGLVGIVVGPVLLGLALVLWRQWGGEDAPPAARQQRGCHPDRPPRRDDAVDSTDRPDR
jgi:predicted PurR-regulated permease PerM